MQQMITENSFHDRFHHTNLVWKCKLGSSLVDIAYMYKELSDDYYSKLFRKPKKMSKVNENLSLTKHVC